MTIEKAHKLLKLAIKNKLKMKHGFLDPQQSWNQELNAPRELASGLAKVLDNDITWLKTIKNQLPPMLKCKHPPEMHDICKGQKYCMACNMDL